MNAVIKIIATLSEADKQQFVLFLKQKNQRGDAKNIQLFKLLTAGKTEDIDEKLYGKPSKNAYHALSKRLFDNLIDFLASKSFAGETSEEMFCMKLLLASRILLEHSIPKVAFKTLSKAEKIASELDLYSILNEIYHTKIQFAHLNSAEKLEEVLHNSEENMKLFLKQFQLNNAYAAIKKDLITSENKNVNEIVMQHFTNFNIEIDTTLTYKSLFQLLTITASSAKLQSDFYSVSPFMLKIYKLLAEKDSVTHKHQTYHMKVLHLMAFSSFRNKDFEKCSEFLEKLEVEMQQNDNQYFKLFEDNLLALKALNLNFTGNYVDALKLLEVNSNKGLNSKLIYIMCLFQQNRFDEAYKIFREFDKTDTYYEKIMGWIWLLKKSIIEILLLIERDKLDLVMGRIESFKRKFAVKLKNINETRTLTFIGFVDSYYKNPELVTTEKFKDTVENSFECIGVEREDIFVMSFYAWLKAKMENTYIYETTLQLVS